jgi:outer membrane protein OmpA-like peptidoglycan-associated protein
MQLYGLRMTATRLSDGRYDFEDLLSSQSSDESAAPRYAVHALSLHNAQLMWRDRAGSHADNLAQLNLQGRVEALSGLPKAELDATLKQLNLAKLQLALDVPMPMTVQQGDAHAQMHVVWSTLTQGASDVKASGQVHLSDVRMEAPKGHSALALKTLRLSLDHMDLRERVLKISELLVEEPQLRLQLVTKPRTEETSTRRADGAWDVDIDRLKLQNGSLSFRDERVQPAFHARVASLNGGVQGLSTRADTQADLQLSGQSSGNAPVAIQARLNPLAPEKFLELRAKVSHMDLPRFSGYMGKYAGYAIEKGKGTMDVAYHLRNGQLTGENHVFIDQLTLGERIESPEATSLPVSLAIALLKNRQGQIELDLPVSGSMDDPQFSLSKLIGQAVWNLVTKVVASPWTFLQSMLGGDETLSQAVFAPGSAVLDAATRQTLDQLARAMHERPALTLEVRGVVDATRDASAMANLPKDEVGKQEALRSLAQRRAQAVQRGLMDSGKVAPERVFVLAPKERQAEMPVNAGVVFTLR